MDSISKIVTCKHSRSRTAVEQACDVCPMFRSIKAISRITTAEIKPNHGLKALVHNAIKTLSADKIFQLSSVKKCSNRLSGLLPKNHDKVTYRRYRCEGFYAEWYA